MRPSSKSPHKSQVLDTLSFYLNNRVVELYGDPESYTAFSTREFSNLVGTTFSKHIPQIAMNVSLFILHSNICLRII